MFQPVTMHYVSLLVLTENVPLVAQILGEQGTFHPEKTEALREQLPEQLGQEFHRQFHSAVNRLNKIIQQTRLLSPKEIIEPYQLVSLEELQSLDAELSKIWAQFSELEEQRHQTQDKLHELKQLFETLEKFKKLDIDLNLLHTPRHFLNLHIGTVPLTNLIQLRDSLALAGHFVQSFHQIDKLAYCVIVGTLQSQEQASSVLKHAEFRPLAIPEEFHSHPQQVHRELTAETSRLQQKIQQIDARKQELASQHHKFLYHAHQLLDRAAAFAELSETLRKRGVLTLIAGWLPQDELPRLQAALQQKLSNPHALAHRPPTHEEFKTVPSLTRHHPIFAAYQALVKNYGIPRYGEFDPTHLFTVSFLLMFGMMFGDVGQGLVIAGAGWYGRKLLKNFSLFFIAAGLSSCLFGFIYGSVFGKHLLTPLWIEPLSDPFLMLQVALYWGVGFISLAVIIKIINSLREGEFAAALFNNTGVAGICLYLGGFYAIRQWMLTQNFGMTQQLAVVIPLAIIFMYKWYENKMPLTERLLVSSIETFESVINYLANTLSFLRVAAFSLNHAALAIAIFTLADMMNGSAWWIMAVAGNVFIIILEGAIVTIQVLRLEYYEGFSRFFSGDGRIFRPLTLGCRTELRPVTEIIDEI